MSAFSGKGFDYPDHIVGNIFRVLFIAADAVVGPADGDAELHLVHPEAVP